MIDVRCPLCKNRYSCEQMGMIPFEHCGMFVIDDTIKRHKTNADRIRSMTDEELADWLVMNGNGSDYQTWLDWLRQEAQE